MSAVIQLEGLTKRYGSARGIVDVDLEVSEGEVFGFLGPNGAGKTTTIRLIMDLIRPSWGPARVFPPAPAPLMPILLLARWFPRPRTLYARNRVSEARVATPAKRRRKPPLQGWPVLPCTISPLDALLCTTPSLRRRLPAARRDRGASAGAGRSPGRR